MLLCAIFVLLPAPESPIEVTTCETRRILCLRKGKKKTKIMNIAFISLTEKNSNLMLNIMITSFKYREARPVNFCSKITFLDLLKGLRNIF